MACPYFVPLEIWPDWTGPRRVPLGEPYRGSCSATAAEIALEAQAAICNFGYARARCPHYPASATIDAVRFSMTTRSDLVWIAERDYAPLGHGIGTPPEYRALAEAFLSSYHKGKCPQGILE